MDKLGEISIDNSLTLNFNATVDQTLLAKNFTTIIQALEQLQQTQKQHEQQIKDLNALQNTVNNLQQQIDKVQVSAQNSNNEANVSDNSNSKSTFANASDLSRVENGLNSLQKRVQKNESGIVENIKDINLLNTELKEAKNDIEELKKKLSLLSSNSEKDTKDTGYNINDIASNLSKELKENEEKMQNIIKRLDQHDSEIKDLNDALSKVRDAVSNNNSNNNGSKGSDDSSVGAQDLQNLKNDLRDKIDVLNKKINILQNDSDQHESDINYLKQIYEQGERDNKVENQNKEEGSLNQSVSADLHKLRKKIDDVDNREKKDIKNLMEEISGLKQQIKNNQRNERIDSKTSLEGDNNGSHRKLSITRDDLTDKINDLILRMNNLEKLLAGGSKNNIGDEKNPQKLPSIHRITKRRGDPNMTGFDKDRSGISRKDIAELKAELQAWLKGLLDSYQNKENFQAIELKLQELRKNVDKKADGEGTKKGFSFLQNKITQLYLFLTEPDTEDAMIVRKGFQCLSCSKKVEKLRGKLGPRINWNNMTSTNYSPPKVGYSKPMGDRSMEKEDDL